MNTDSLSFFNLASERLRWLAARQEVVSQNIANADTPGFKAQQVTSFSDLMDGGRPAATGLSVTRAGHIVGSGSGPSGIETRPDRSAWEQSIDGNTVALEQQVIAATDTEDSYRLAADLYKKGHQLVMLATGGNG